MLVNGAVCAKSRRSSSRSVGPLTGVGQGVRLWVFRHDQKVGAVAPTHADGGTRVADGPAVPLLWALGHLSNAARS